MAEITVLSDKKKQAIELNEQIIFKAQLAQKNLYDMCVMLKQMRDEKLYRELGHATFEEYCENEIGFSREQGRKYISIIENKNANSSWHLGVTKLYLLSTLSESQQEEIQQNVNLEETSVRQLKAEIEKLKDDNNKIRSAKISVESDLLSVKSDNRSLRHCLSEANKNLDEANEKIKELESRPIEVAVVEDKDAQAQIKQLSRELSEADQNHVNEVQKIRREYQNQINDLSRQLTEMTEQAETEKIFLDVDAILCPCINNLSTAMEMLIDALEKINNPSSVKEARKKVNDYYWQADDIFEIFFDKFGRNNV